MMMSLCVLGHGMTQGTRNISAQRQTSKARILKYYIKDEKFCFSFRNNIMWETQL